MRWVSLQCSQSGAGVPNRFAPSGILGLNWIAFRKMTRQNPPGRLITTLYRDGVMYVAAILGERCSYCFLVYSCDDLKVFSVINATVTFVSSSHTVYTTFNQESQIQYSDILNSWVSSRETLNLALLTSSIS